MNNLNFGRYIGGIRKKDGDKYYRAMLPCFYVEKTSEVMGCALVPLRPKNDSNSFFKKTDMRNCLKNSGDVVLVIFLTLDKV